MSYITYVTDRATNAQSDAPDSNTISLGGPSDIKLNIKREDIAALEQRGDDLVVTLQDGTELLIEDFYVASESGLPSRLIIDGDVIAAPEISSGLLIAGVLALGSVVVVGLALGGGGSDNTAADTALAKIEAYNNGDGTTPAALTVADYTAAGITGVTAANLAAVNANVLAAATGGADTAPEVQALVNTLPPAAKIDLSGEAGFGGQLIAPVQLLINGVTRTFYYWDRSGDGTSSGADTITHNVLDNLFNAGLDTTDATSDRSYTMADGTVLRLPTLGTTVGRDVDSDETVASSTENQTVLDGLAAIKDAFDGPGMGAGVPAGWAVSYWSATSTGAGEHAVLYLTGGNSNRQSDGVNVYVALEVV